MAELNIGALTGSKSYTGSVGTTNIDNLYKFTINSPGSFKFAIDNLSGNADIFLLNQAGAIIQSSSNSDKTAETISAEGLSAGEYTIRVLQISGDIKYTLNLAQVSSPKNADADTLTGTKLETTSPSTAVILPVVSTSEKPTANKDAITGTLVQENAIAAADKIADTDKPATTLPATTTDKPVTTTSTITDKPATTLPATTASTTIEKPVTTTSTTTEKPETTTSTISAVSTASTTIEKPVTTTSTTTEKPETTTSTTSAVSTASTTTEKPITTTSTTTEKPATTLPATTTSTTEKPEATTSTTSAVSTTIEKPVTTTSTTEKPEATTSTTSAVSTTIEKPVTTASTTSAVSTTIEKPVTTTSTTSAVSTTTEKPVTTTSTTTDKPVTTTSTTSAVSATTEKPATTLPATASTTTEKPVAITSTITDKPATTVPATTNAAATTAVTKDPLTGETLAAQETKTGTASTAEKPVTASLDASKPADKPNTATSNAEETKKETTTTAIPATDTKKEPEPTTDKKLTSPFTSGIFTADATGRISIDYLLDGGLFKGELAVFTLDGLENFVPGSEAFIKEVASRSLSNSVKGHVVINDATEGARFSGLLPEGNFNEGVYLGVKSFAVTAGGKYGVMLVPNGSVKFVYDNPTFGGDKRPLFSMATANPMAGFNFGQIADITGEGNTFVMEDMRLDAGSDKDYNDIIFQVRGATAKAALLDTVINPDKDWRKTDLGKAVIAYAKPYITPEPKPKVDPEVSDLLDDLEKEILKPVTSDKETPRTPSPTPTTGKDSDDSKQPVPISIPPSKIEEKAKDSASNGGDSTKVETSDKVDTKLINSPTTDKDTAADSTEKLPVEKRPVPPVVTEVKDKVTESPATATLPAKSTVETEVIATTPTEKVETKPEFLPTESKVKEETKPAMVTEVKDKVTEVAVTGTSPVKSVTDKEVVATIPTQKVETKPEVLPVESKVKEESKPVVVTEVKDKVTEVAVTETLPVKSATEKEVIAMTPTQKVETQLEVLPTESKVKDEILPVVSTNTGNDVNADWIARLESIKQRLSNLGGVDVVAENAIDRTSIARLEVMTEKLREQTRSTPVSDNTAALISRLEDMVVQVAPKQVEPVQPVQFEFPVANRPLVGFITDTGLTVNNPAEEKSPIVAEEKPANSTNNPSPSANGVNNPSQPVVRDRDNSSQWVESLIKFVDAAKVSKQPHAVVNININLTQTQPDGTVIPRKELTAAERSAIAYAYQNNVIIVVPAGDNPGTMSALGLLSKEVDNVVTVGAAQRFNDSVALSNAFKLADYSGSGNTLDILANGSSGNTSSTKVAAVEVTNAIAQVLAANPKLNYTQAIDLIKRTATDLDRPNWDAQTGSGLLNVAAAVQLAKVTTPELYTIKPGQRSITDVFISQHPSTKQLPGDPTHPTVKVPGIPQTNVDRGSNNLANATKLIPSATEDVIDQVSSVDPSDIYRVDSRYLNGAKFSVLSGDLSVSYLTTSGQLLGTQSLSKGSHKLQLPANAPAEVIVKIDQRNANPATYILSGFESTATEPFNIDLEYETPLSASQQAIMQAAAKSVAGLIGKGLPSAVVDGKIIDDINIKISTANIDGASGTQARTKIDFMRYGTMLPAQSLVQFDAADIAELERSGKLFSVVQHEFLHALGFGNLWEAKGLVDYAGTPLAQYNGGKAVDAFKDLGGLTDAISLETEGKGSAGFHWNEALFQDEVMTADLNFSGKAGNAPISPVTIASLADLGYEVNLKGATPDFGLFGGGRFNAADLTPEQIEAFRQLAEIFGDGDEPSEPAILQEVDPSKVAPEIWAHAERAPNGQYYDWERYKIVWGDTLSDIAAWRMGSGSATNYWWIANRNGIPNPDKIYEYDTIDIPVHRPNYEQQQEAERQRREQELRERQEREARERQQQEDRLRNNQAEQERLRQDEERRRREAEANQRALEEQARRLAAEQERRRREREEYEREQVRLAELRRQAEIARQQGKGGLDWYLAKPMPEFGPVDPFEISLTGETVGNLVPDDYYRFTLSRGGRITAELRKLLADADLVLYDVRNEPIAYSMREGITDEQIIADLIPGTYMLRVNSPKGVTTDYELIVKFQHKLSATQTQPLPPGWRPSGGGNSGGSGGGNTSPGVTFADPRIKQIYNTALNQFETAERGKANARIRDLEAEKRQYQQELNDLLARMNAEQRNKVYTALDGVRNDAFRWLDSLGEANGFDNFVNGIFDKIPSRLYNVPGIGNALSIARDNAKGAFNGALSWIKGKVNSARTEIKNAVSWFVEALKNAYRTGGEINSAIEGLAREFKGKIDAQVANINNGIDWFKTEVIKPLGGLRNVGAFGWNFYDNLVVPQADNLANLVKGGVGAIANSLKGTVDYVKPRAQKTVADILSALLGDQTGNLYNKINKVDEQIAATRTGLEKAIATTGQYILNVAQQIEAFLTDSEERKRVLEALWEWGFKTVDEAYNFIVKKRDEVRKEIEAEGEARQKAEEEANRKAEEEVRGELEQQGHPLPDSITPVTLAIWVAKWNLLPSGTHPELGVHNHLKRHYFENLELQPKSKGTNSYILGQPATPSQNWGIYQEAVWKAYKEDPKGFLKKVATKSRGVISVNLTNGQVWLVNPADGTLIPSKGPNILDLSAKDARYLDDIIQGLNQGKSSKDVLNAVNAKRLADGTTTISPKMETALKELQRLKGIPDSHIASTFGNYKAVNQLGLADDAAKTLDDAAKFKAAGRTYNFVKWGGRTLVVIGLAVDGYEVYVAENKEEKVAEKVGAWAGSAIAAYGVGQTAAYVLAPVNTVPVWGQFAYGVGVAGASIAGGIGGYMAGEEAGKIVYKWFFEKVD